MSKASCGDKLKKIYSIMSLSTVWFYIRIHVSFPFQPIAGIFLFLQIDKISVSHDSRQSSSGWYLEEVTVDVPSRGDHTVFPSHCWLASGKGDGKIVRDFVSRPCKW